MDDRSSGSSLDEWRTYAAALRDEQHDADGSRDRRSRFYEIPDNLDGYRRDNSPLPKWW